MLGSKNQTMRIGFPKLMYGLVGICAALIIQCVTVEAQDDFILNESPEDFSIVGPPVVETQPWAATDTKDLQNQVAGDEQVPESPRSYFDQDLRPESSTSQNEIMDSLSNVQVGYDGGFLIASQRNQELQASDSPFLMRINGWGQVRQTTFSSANAKPDRNQFQLARARLIFSGSAFTEDFAYFFQFDGRSSSGDNFRLLDYLLTYDLGHHVWGLDKGTVGFKAGKYKMPFDMARYLSARELEFNDRSMASTFFDVNRSLAWGLYGRSQRGRIPWNWEAALFNGLVTGGAETGSSGSLDNNFAYSARAYCYPTGDWGVGELADFKGHCRLATRVGAGFANSTIDKSGSTEFEAVRVVDSGLQLAMVLPDAADQYTVSLYSIDASMKYSGWSATFEYYFRQINDIQGASVPDLFDHGHWLQIGKFAVPDRLELLTRWSRVQGNSGTLGTIDQESMEIATGFAWYIRDQNAKFTADATFLDGAPISSSALDINPGDAGWLFRTQVQFAF